MEVIKKLNKRILLRYQKLKTEKKKTIKQAFIGSDINGVIFDFKYRKTLILKWVKEEKLSLFDLEYGLGGLFILAKRGVKTRTFYENKKSNSVIRWICVFAGITQSLIDKANNLN